MTTNTRSATTGSNARRSANSLNAGQQRSLTGRQTPPQSTTQSTTQPTTLSATHSATAHSANSSPSWDSLMRYRLIEIIALWEGRLTTNHLQENFQIQRSQASKVLSRYRELAPSNLTYCTKSKGYVPTAEFKPLFTQGVADEYLQALSSKADIAQTFTGVDVGFDQDRKSVV